MVPSPKPFISRSVTLVSTRYTMYVSCIFMEGVVRFSCSNTVISIHWSKWVFFGYIYIYIYIWGLCMSISECVYVSLSFSFPLCISVCVCENVFACINIIAYVCVSVCVSVCVYGCWYEGECLCGRLTAVN